MLSGLLEKLEQEHGIAPAQGSSILNTIAQHIKEQFPQVGGMIDSVLGTQSSGSTTSTGSSDNNTGSSGNTLENLEEMAKSKLGGIFGN